MKILTAAALALGGLLAMLQAHSDSAGTDTVTRLPLPDAASSIRLDSSPMPMSDVPVCKSVAAMNFYTVKSGTVDAAVAWYTANLKGFKHTHGIGSGRSQDTFYNPAGTLIVAITGKPAAAGQNADAYSIIYSTIQPGASEKVIVGMNIQKVDCT